MRFVSKKTTVSFDRDKYLRDFSRKAKSVLKKVGNKLKKMLASNLASLNGYPSEWRGEMVAALDNKLMEETDGFIKYAVGLTDLTDDEFALIRARILEHGTGSRGEENGYAIWHWQGVKGLNSDVTGYNVSYKKSFPLPDEFNMSPGHWFSDACILIEEIFADAAETMLKELNPLEYIKLK